MGNRHQGPGRGIEVKLSATILMDSHTDFPPTQAVPHFEALPPGVSVVVPVYNSAETLPLLIGRLQPVLESLAMPFEVILVNDGSADASWQGIVDLARSHAWVRGLCLTRNYGQHNALLAGLRHARYHSTVTMDDDLQNPPEEIPKLLAKFEEGFEVVYGAPDRRKHSAWRNLTSSVMRWMLRVAMGVKLAAEVSAFRAIRTDIRGAFERYYSPHVNLDVLLTWGSTRFVSVKVKHDPRQRGESVYRLRTLVSHGLAMVTGYSTLPLRLASLAGFTFTLFGVGVLTYVIVCYFKYGGSLPGFPFLASIIALFSGAQLFALGVIGEYLARIHFRMMDRPVYAIRTATDAAVTEKR
jgi:undecaprenyl-phosphate 4-deoxy-4-formamido-L-arabinose transferase